MVPDYLDTLPISHVTVWHFTGGISTEKIVQNCANIWNKRSSKKSLCWSLSALIMWPKKVKVRLSETIRLNTRQWHSYLVRFSAKLKKLSYPNTVVFSLHFWLENDLVSKINTYALQNLFWERLAKTKKWVKSLVKRCYFSKFV